MLVLAHVSDTHIDGGERSVDRTTRVMLYLASLSPSPDAVVLTGDLADHGAQEEYKQLRELLELSPAPVLMCPGNHDVRGAYRSVLLDGGDSTEPVNSVHEVAGAVFAMCDSSIPGRDDGFLADETIGWLDGVLSRVPAGTPSFIGFHHPPVVLHAPYVDVIRQHGDDRLAEVVERHSHVAALLCGHAHLAGATTFAGRPLLVAPGVASTVRLAWEPGEDVDYRPPPAVAFHVLDETGRLITHYRVVM